MTTTVIKYKEISRAQFYNRFKNINWCDDVEDVSNKAASFDCYYIPKRKIYFILYPIYGNKETAFFYGTQLNHVDYGYEDTKFYVQIK